MKVILVLAAAVFANSAIAASPDCSLIKTKLSCSASYFASNPLVANPSLSAGRDTKEFKLRITGDSPEENRCEAVVDIMDAANGFEFHGYLSEQNDLILVVGFRGVSTAVPVQIAPGQSREATIDVRGGTPLAGDQNKIRIYQAKMKCEIQ